MGRINMPAATSSVTSVQDGLVYDDGGDRSGSGGGSSSGGGAAAADEKLAEKVSDEDKATLEKAVEETIAWLDANQLAEKEEFADRQKSLEEIVNPIMQRAYSAAGGATGTAPGAPADMGGMDATGMGGGGVPDGVPSGGPKIEEVD